MKCEYEPAQGNYEWPTFRCINCGRHVQVRSSLPAQYWLDKQQCTAEKPSAEDAGTLPLSIENPNDTKPMQPQNATLLQPPLTKYEIFVRSDE